MATKKKVTLSLDVLKNTKVRVGIIAAAFVAVALVSSSLGDSSGYKRGFADGDKNGFANGDKAGFEKGYWIGSENGCLWVIDQGNRTYVIGIGNPGGGLFFQDLGNIYISKDNCDVTGHGAAPYQSSPYSSGVEDTN